MGKNLELGTLATFPKLPTLRTGWSAMTIDSSMRLRHFRIEMARTARTARAARIADISKLMAIQSSKALSTTSKSAN